MHTHALLQTAPAGRHFAQFHKESTDLADSVAEYVMAGLRRGERIILILVPDHAELITSRTIGAVLGRKSSVVRATRAYGEMVNVLWHRGLTDAAIRLEEYWNRIAGEYSFALMCCYTMDGLDEGTYSHPLHEIGRTHSDILSAPNDVRFKDAVDRASNEILGNTLSLTLSLSGREDMTGEHRLPAGQRSILWLKRNMPNLYTRVLDRARALYEGQFAHSRM
jgi:hypothetical protein